MSADPAETILLTIFLKHDQSKNLDGIQGHLAATGWWERFPPKGVEIVSWNVVMGIGQIVTLRLPPHLINVVNVEIERCAWGTSPTEFFPTYDFVPVRDSAWHANGAKRGSSRPARCAHENSIRTKYAIRNGDRGSTFLPALMARAITFLRATSAFSAGRRPMIRRNFKKGRAGSRVSIKTI